MKRIIKIMILIIVILNAFLQTISCAAIEVNKENLKIGFEKFKEMTNKEEEKVNFNIKDDEIDIIIKDEGTKKMQYDLKDKPTFSIETLITKDMDYETYCDETSNNLLTVYGFYVVANIANVDFIDSIAYSTQKLFIDSLKNTSSSEFIDITNFDAIEFAKKSYKEGTTYNYEFFNMVIGKANETSDTYTIKTTLTVNNDADFSKLQGYAEKNEFKIELKPSTNQNTIVNDTNDVEDNNSQANLSEIPRAGGKFGLDNILEIIIICAVLLLVSCLLKDRRKEYGEKR